VAKSKPLRKVPQTDAIFEAVHRINREADADVGTIRLSLDTKTVVPIGQLSRGGKSRQAHQALDHDLEPVAKLTPFGIHRPDTAETWLSFTTGSATADFMPAGECTSNSPNRSSPVGIISPSDSSAHSALGAGSNLPRAPIGQGDKDKDAGIDTKMKGWQA
jgi:hypothetical protein